MSAPKTNIETERKKHKPMLSGGILFGVIAAAALIGLVAYMSAGGDVPVGGDIEPVVTDEQSP